MSLEPITADQALDLYLTDKENELTEASLKGHKYRLGHFVRWCHQEDIDNLNELTGRQLHEYRLWRRDDGDLNKVSEKTQMDTFRVFIRWLESIDGVEQDLTGKVLSPSITPDESSRDVMLDCDSASKVLAHLEKYEHASIQHVSIALMWHTMMRVGGVHALDVDDRRVRSRAVAGLAGRTYEQDDAPCLRLPVDASLCIQHGVSARPRPRRVFGSRTGHCLSVSVKRESSRNSSRKHHA
jgi:site-specific recombinase XerC